MKTLTCSLYVVSWLCYIYPLKNQQKNSLRFQKFDLTIAIQVEKADCVVMIIFFENVRSSVY